MNRLGAKTPPDPPMPIVRLVAIILPTRSARGIHRVFAGDTGATHRIPHAIHFRQHEQQATEQKPAGRGPQPLRATPRPIAGILDPVQDPGEADPGGAGEYT